MGESGRGQARFSDRDSLIENLGESTAPLVPPSLTPGSEALESSLLYPHLSHLWCSVTAALHTSAWELLVSALDLLNQAPRSGHLAICVPAKDTPGDSKADGM